MSEVTFDEIVRAWLLHYDDRLPSDRVERREALIILLDNLLDHGYNKESLTLSKKERIVKYCVNPNHKNKKKLRAWVAMLVNDLEAAILIKYPVVKIRTDGITPEIKIKLDAMEKKAEEQRALKTEDDDDDEEDSGEFSIEDHMPLNIRDAVENPVKPPESFRITKETLGEMETPEILWDEDFAKKMGLDE